MDEVTLFDGDGAALPALTGLTSAEVEKNLRAFMDDREAYSENTFKKLMVVIRSWSAWCVERGISPLPVLPGDARDYFLTLHDAGLASSSIDNHYAMLNMLLRISGLPDLKNSNQVQLALKKIRRISVMDGEKTGQAVPFRFTDLQIANHILSQSDRPADLRNRAFLFVAYNTLLRVQEIARIRVRDVSVKDERVVLELTHTKTMLTAAGVIKHLSLPASRVLLEWLRVSNLNEHPEAVIFSAVRKNGTVTVTDKPMTTPTLEKIFQDIWRKMGKDDEPANKGRYKTWSGHSARVGAAQDMADRDVSMTQIMHEGTWAKPETVMRYLRKLQNRNSAMTDIMEK
ncbi:tyrosine-type recombinase/integrase [Leclercia adecarboxylata]|uniref:tyrosine-type recombinase/integrase n=1 Tax=Leclercia adecarboxylata TaxID=83655 RepID=UPI0021005474|nr:tyrosine-type recombinase/integrase [Leclercia adecarboxylata]